MNKLNNKVLLYLTIILFPFSSVFCQSKNEKEFVWFVVQPEAELGKSIDFTIHFKEKPDSIYRDSNEITGLELTDNLDRVLSNISESNITYDKDKVIQTFYSFYTYAKPTKLGRIDFPILSVKYKGKVYKSLPFSINVVEKIKVEPDDVKVIWSSDKPNYNKKDTIVLSLYEYSKFSKTFRKKSSPKNSSIKGKENQINISAEKNNDDISGIEGFEKLIDKKFEIVNFDWDWLRNNQSMEKIDNELYIKTLILELHLLAKTQQTFEAGQSEYNFLLYKSNTDYFNKFVSNDDGSYNITENGAVTLKIKSNKLTIKIE